MSEPTDSSDVVSAVGRVLGTEDSTRPASRSTQLNEDADLQLDDVVITARSVPGFGQVTMAGVVTRWCVGRALLSICHSS